MSVLHLDQLQSDLPQLKVAFASARPFPHVVLHDAIVPAVLAQAHDAFPPADAPLWTHYRHANERKQGSPRRALYPPVLQQLIRALQGPAFVAWLQELTGEPGLFADPSLEGAGLHMSERGGFLNVHTDFQRHHHHPTWRRTVNLILFLNPDWDPSWGGAIELWNAEMSACEVKVSPLANRAVIFRSDHRSFHGHPEPLACPPHRQRRSLALYYYTHHDGVLPHEHSRFAPRPGDSLAKRVVLRVDNHLVQGFSQLKRWGLSSDRAASRVLKRLDGLRRK